MVEALRCRHIYLREGEDHAAFRTRAIWWLIFSSRRKRQKTENQVTVATTKTPAPSGSGPTPPYPVRKTSTVEPATTTTTGATSKRRTSEQSEYPWNRQLNFQVAKANASWNLSIYQASTLAAMEKVRKENAVYVRAIDFKDDEKLRKSHSLIIRYSARLTT